MSQLISVGKVHFNFIYISPAELFVSYMKLAVISGLVLSSPIIFLQVWLFVKPSMNAGSKKYMYFALFFGIFFFLIGAGFAYKVVLPLTIQFFGSMTIEDIQPMISVSNYIGFIVSILLSFGIIFEMPMLVVILSKIGLITSNFLKTYRKYIILLIFILAAILTPPDVASQILLAIPMLILYEISIFLAKIVESKKEKTINTKKV